MIFVGKLLTYAITSQLVLLRYLIFWALSSSEVIRAILNENYKTNRRNDDLNVALSIQPWGRDADKRRYWLIEGRGKCSGGDYMGDLTDRMYSR